MPLHCDWGVAIMKRAFRSVAVCTLMLLSLSGCMHLHTWVDATCTEPKTCSECGETEGEPLGHDWIPATYTEPKTCSRCGATEGEPKRPTITTLSGAADAIEACFNLIPNCELDLQYNSSNSYSITYDYELIGILGVELDEFDVAALIDPSKPNYEQALEQIGVAIMLASDSSLDYSEALDLYNDVKDEGTSLSGGIFYSVGYTDDMLAVGVDFLYLS